MKADFWHERWENNFIGFHLDEVNPNLTTHWNALGLDKGKTVFVPLCGKSLDLVWLVEQGYKVVGIEISRKAVKDFFAENKLTPEITKEAEIEKWSSGNIVLYCGDFFDMTAHKLGAIDAVYDRASLIALPGEMREDYVNKLQSLIQSSPVLLVTLEYEQRSMKGPPFAVFADEVQSLFASNYQISRLASNNIIDENERFKAKGLGFLNEVTYLLKK